MRLYKETALHLSMSFIVGLIVVIGISISLCQATLYEGVIEPTMVNPHDYDWIQLPRPCSDETILFSVHSSAMNLQRRMLLRNTWLNPSIINPLLGTKVKVVFFVGVPSGRSRDMLDQRLDYEQELYHDIVQENYIDAYKNNTHKLMSHLKWVSGASGCRQADFIIKLDDDAFVKLRRLPEFIDYIRAHIPHNGSAYMGLLMSASRSHPNRDPSSKWYLSTDAYPDSTFPPWMLGLLYVITPNIASSLYDTALKTPYIFTDDAFLGILVNRNPNVRVLTLARFYSPALIGHRIERAIRPDTIAIQHLPDPLFFFYESVYNRVHVHSQILDQNDKYFMRQSPEMVHDLLMVDVSINI